MSDLAENVEGWADIARVWKCSERTARRWGALCPAVRRHRLTRKVFGRRVLLEQWKAAYDVGESRQSVPMSAGQ